MSLVAGIDSSTQSCKLEVRDADTGELVRSGQRPHSPTVPPRSEQDPVEWWAALTSLLEEHGLDVSAISVAGQQHGMVVLDDEHRVLRPAKLWNDTESAPQADCIGTGAGARRRGPTSVGTVPVASFTVTKLAWLREHEPDALRSRSAGAAPPRLVDAAAQWRVGHRPRRRVGHWLLVAVDRVPTSPMCSASSISIPTSHRRCSNLRVSPVPMRSAGRRGRDRRQHGRRARPRSSPRATLRSRSAPRAPCSPCRGLTRRTTRPARWPASPTPPVASCPSRAR